MASTKQAAAIQLPSIADLGRLQAALSREYNRLDASGSERRFDAMDLISQQQDGINALIGTMPARSLVDCAVQLGVAGLLASFLESDDDQSSRAKRAAAIERMMISTIKVIIDAAKLDAAEFDLAEFGRLHEARFPVERL